MNKLIPVCEPFLNGNELKYVSDAVSSGWISSGGKYVTAFEEMFAAYCDCKYGVAVCNGTVALHLALVALGIGKGDEVIIPTFTMVASAFAVCYTGATPVFVDANPQTWNIDIYKIEKKITHKTKAIMPVHIFGQMCEMDAIELLAKKYNLFIIEDAAEAHGAEYKQKKAGSFSDIASFSFFANKNITTGEGGMVVTNNENLYQKAKYYKNICFPLDGNRNYTHNDMGFNYRMSNVLAAIGLAQTEKADKYKLLRVINNQTYRKYLATIPGIRMQYILPECLSVSWMNGIVIEHEYGRTRDQLIAFLKENGVDTRLFFNGMHNQPSLLSHGCDCSGKYPVSDYLSQHGFYLPSGSNLTEETIQYICNLIDKFSPNKNKYE